MKGEGDTYLFQYPRSLRAVRVTVVGCGGTGSHLVDALCGLLFDLEECRRGRVALPPAALGRYPLSVRLVDPDRVEHRNIGRSAFAHYDVGCNKAEALAERYADAYGLPIEAHALPFSADHDAVPLPWGTVQLLVGCVDNAAARAEMHRAVEKGLGSTWHLDAGNTRNAGQVFFGTVARRADLAGAFQPALGLCRAVPAPAVLRPGLLTLEDGELPEARWSTARSPRPPAGQDCAARVLAREQSFAINRLVANAAFDLLHDLFVGELRHFAAYINREEGTQVRAERLTPTAMARVLGETPASLGLLEATSMRSRSAVLSR
jgi:PRTRC genetic system ThiF family protein